jgi:two-component system response regulator FlrC
LLAYHWPGNVRELENAMQRALLMCDGRLIEPEHVELDVPGLGAVDRTSPSLDRPSEGGGSSVQTAPSQAGIDLAKEKVPQDIESIERDHILKVLAQVGGNRKEAVAILGLSERALRYKLKAYKEAGFEFD